MWLSAFKIGAMRKISTKFRTKSFPKSNEYYIKNHPPQNVVELWLSIGASTKDEIEKVMQGHLVTKNAEQSLIPTTQP